MHFLLLAILGNDIVKNVNSASFVKFGRILTSVKDYQDNWKLFMATIIESVVVEDSVQADGRRCIRERYTDSLGSIYEVTYLAEAEQDVTTILLTRAQQILEQVERQEIDTLSSWANAIDDEVPQNESFRYTSPALYYARLRERFQGATGLRAMRIGVRLAPLANAQLRTIFSYTAAQATTLRTKLNAMVALVGDVRNQVGE